jgi:hypothetical protein
MTPIEGAISATKMATIHLIRHSLATARGVVADSVMPTHGRGAPQQKP